MIKQLNYIKIEVKGFLSIRPNTGYIMYNLQYFFISKIRQVLLCLLPGCG
jgi:hypothetical protein